jgi:hypothetical protein
MGKKWKVEYRESALLELETIILQNRDLQEIIIQRLAALEEFPPEKWFEIRHHHGTDLFISDNQMIHISGQADAKTSTVWIHKVVVVRKNPH